MNKLTLASLTLMAGIIAGGGGAYWFVKQQISETMAMNDSMVEERKPLFYRHPMNPEITSPVPAKGGMGMDYIAVYADVKTSMAERKPLFYRHPMNPDITSPVPAKGGMGMDYIAVYADNDDDMSMAPSGTVKIDPVMVQNIGVRTAYVSANILSHDIRTIGRVTYDEQRMSRLHPKTHGWIEKLFIDKKGTFVKKGTILLSVYSPQLVSSSQEYLLALRSLKTLKDSPFEDIRSGAEQMVKIARERLEFLDVSRHQIKEMEKTGTIKKALHIHSPYTGTVMRIGAREGQHVSPDTELYMMADLSKVWVFADVYEADLPWVKEGDPVEMTLKGIPGKVFTGTLSYIYPYAEAKTRTIKVRLEFDNADLLLKPNMFANVIINTQLKRNAITVPSEAIVRSGEREQVFVVREKGKFEPRTVVTGLSSKGMTQIISGVSIGERVVTSSQFLIDSESKLRESTAKMLEALKVKENNSGMNTDKDMNMDKDMDMDKGMDMDKDMNMDQGMIMNERSTHGVN